MNPAELTAARKYMGLNIKDQVSGLFYGAVALLVVFIYLFWREQKEGDTK